MEKEAEAGYQCILELRCLYRELNIVIRDAYGCADPSTDSTSSEAEKK